MATQGDTKFNKSTLLGRRGGVGFATTDGVNVSFFYRRLKVCVLAIARETLFKALIGSFQQPGYFKKRTKTLALWAFVGTLGLEVDPFPEGPGIVTGETRA